MRLTICERVQNGLKGDFFLSFAQNLAWTPLAAKVTVYYPSLYHKSERDVEATLKYSKLLCFPKFFDECKHLIIMGIQCSNCRQDQCNKQAVTSDIEVHIKNERTHSQVMETPQIQVVQVTEEEKHQPARLSTAQIILIQSHIRRYLAKKIYLQRKGSQQAILKKEILVNANGIKYEGETRNGVKHGYGIQYLPDGGRYEGMWVNGLAHGKGSYTHASGEIYTGQWVRDEASGYGRFQSADGTIYEGQWLNNQQHGFGQQIWPDGSTYQGQFVNGLRQGRGTIKTQKGFYDGEWFNGKMHGHGTYQWFDEKRKYSGQWLNGKIHGRGIYSWGDGRKYEGDYVNDQKQGFGIFHWGDGRMYTGYWLNGRQHGEGIFTDKNGKQTKGTWKDGKMLKDYEF